MEGNRICRQIEWYNDESKTRAWREGKTGYPWIDAIIRQLITEGLFPVRRLPTETYNMST